MANLPYVTPTPASGGTGPLLSTGGVGSLSRDPKMAALAGLFPSVNTLLDVVETQQQQDKKKDVESAKAAITQFRGSRDELRQAVREQKIPSINTRWGMAYFLAQDAQSVVRDYEAEARGLVPQWSVAVNEDGHAAVPVDINQKLSDLWGSKYAGKSFALATPFGAAAATDLKNQVNDSIVDAFGKQKVVNLTNLNNTNFKNAITTELGQIKPTSSAEEIASIFGNIQTQQKNAIDNQALDARSLSIIAIKNRIKVMDPELLNDTRATIMQIPIGNAPLYKDSDANAEIETAINERVAQGRADTRARHEKEIWDTEGQYRDFTNEWASIFSEAAKPGSGLAIGTIQDNARQALKESQEKYGLANARIEAWITQQSDSARVHARDDQDTIDSLVAKMASGDQDLRADIDAAFNSGLIAGPMYAKLLDDNRKHQEAHRAISEVKPNYQSSIFNGVLGIKAEEDPRQEIQKRYGTSGLAEFDAISNEYKDAAGFAIGAGKDDDERKRLLQDLTEKTRVKFGALLTARDQKRTDILRQLEDVQSRLGDISPYLADPKTNPWSAAPFLSAQDLANAQKVSFSIGQAKSNANERIANHVLNEINKGQVISGIQKTIADPEVQLKSREAIQLYQKKFDEIRKRGLIPEEVPGAIEEAQRQAAIEAVSTTPTKTAVKESETGKIPATTQAVNVRTQQLQTIGAGEPGLASDMFTAAVRANNSTKEPGELRRSILSNTNQIIASEQMKFTPGDKEALTPVQSGFADYLKNPESYGTNRFENAVVRSAQKAYEMRGEGAGRAIAMMYSMGGLRPEMVYKETIHVEPSEQIKAALRRGASAFRMESGEPSDPVMAWFLGGNAKRTQAQALEALEKQNATYDVPIPKDFVFPAWSDFGWKDQAELDAYFKNKDTWNALLKSPHVQIDPKAGDKFYEVQSGIIRARPRTNDDLYTTGWSR